MKVHESKTEKPHVLYTRRIRCCNKNFLQLIVIKQTNNILTIIVITLLLSLLLLYSFLILPNFVNLFTYATSGNVL